MGTATSGLEEILASDWERSARFYARFGISEEMFRHGVPAGNGTGECVATTIRSPTNAGYSSGF